MKNNPLIHIYGALAAFFAVFFWLYNDNFPRLITQWNTDDYSYCYLVPLVFVYLLYDNRQLLKASAGDGRLFGYLALAGAALFYFVGLIGSLETFVYASMWLSIGAILLLLLGNGVLGTIAFPMLILLFAIPLPSFLTRIFSLKLRIWSSVLSVRMLHLFDITAYQEGNVIDLAVTQLQVVDACSGLRYFFPTVLLALLMGYLFTSRLWSRALLLVISPIVALVSNAFRIFVTGVLVKFISPELAHGFFHDFSGWLVYVFSIIILGAGCLLLRKVERSGKRTPPQEPELKVSGPAAVLHAVVALAVMAGFGFFSQQYVSAQIIPEHRPLKEEFPMQFGNWRGERMFLSDDILDSLWADDYVTGDFVNDKTGNRLHLLVSYYEMQTTRHSAHAPTSCLLGGGWVMSSKRVLPPSPETGRPFPVSQMVLKQGKRSLLSNFWFQQRGRHIVSEWWNKAWLIWDAVTKRRTDGALVRVEMYLNPGQSVTEGQELLDGFVGELKQELHDFIPDE
jgi:exosortase D (VPLPA-CTERM-specific)